MINIEYKITEQEYKDFCLYTGWLSPDKKNRRIKYYATNLLIYIGGLFFLYSFSGNFHFDLSTAIIIIVIATLLFLYLRFRIKSFYDRQVKKIIKDSGEDKILSRSNLVFNESGISCQTDSAEVKYSWQAISKTVDINNCYYLYISSIQAIIVPKRVFVSTTEKERFEKTLLQYIPLQVAFKNIV